MSCDALDIGHTLLGGVEYHDNIALTENDPEEEWIRRIGAELSATEQSRRLFLDFEGRVIYEDYAGDAFDDQPRSELEGRFAWHIVPEGLDWRAEAVRREEVSDPTGAPTPDNLEQVDVVWTGPGATFHLTPVDELLIGGRYGLVDYELQDADSERWEGHVRWRHHLNAHSSLTANYDSLFVEYEEQSTFGDFERQDGYLTYLRETEIIGLQVDAGSTLISRRGREDIRGYLAAARLSREINSTSSSWLSVSHGYTDGGTRLLASTDTPVWEDLPSIVVGDDLLFEQRYDIAHEKSWGSADWELRAFEVDEDFESSLLDRRTRGGVVELDYAFSPLTNAGLVFAYSEQDYLIVDRLDEDKTVRFDLQRQLTRRWRLSAEVRHNQRISSEAGESYEANVGLVTILYEFQP